MKNLVVLLTLLFFSPIYGQDQSGINASRIQISDTLKLPLTNIEKSDYVLYFRLKLSGQTIEIFSSDTVSFYGSIQNQIIEYGKSRIDGKERTQSNHLLYEKIPMDSSLAKYLADLILRSGQLSISQIEIAESHKRWYLHCGGLSFEFKYKEKYIEQIFNCPWNQHDTFSYKELVLSNFTTIERILGLDSIYRSFTSRIPKGKTYSKDGYKMMYIMTEDQEAYWNKSKPDREYLFSIKDSIDKYLKSELKKHTINLEGINCFKSFSLSFNKAGDLVNIETIYQEPISIFDGLGFYLDKNREIRNCKKLIKNLFKEINLSSFHLEYPLKRILHFGIDGEIQIRDNTLY